MVGIVIVSHSEKLAEGVVEISKMMAKSAPVAAAGGLEDGSLGPSYDRIRAAIESVYSEDGVIILADMGAAIMTTEIVLEDLALDKVKLVDCPLVEGAVFAAVESAGGMKFEELSEHVKKSRAFKKLDDDEFSDDDDW